MLSSWIFTLKLKLNLTNYNISIKMQGAVMKLDADCQKVYKKVVKEKLAYAIFELNEVTIFSFKHIKIY